MASWVNRLFTTTACHLFSADVLVAVCKAHYLCVYTVQESVLVPVLPMWV